MYVHFFRTPGVSYLKSPVDIKVCFSGTKCCCFFTRSSLGYSKLLSEPTLPTRPVPRLPSAASGLHGLT